MNKHFVKLGKVLLVAWIVALLAWVVLPVQAQQTVIKYLRQLQDVRLGTLSNGDVLSYNSTAGRWTNSAAAAGSGTVTGVTNTGSGATLINNSNSPVPILKSLTNDSTITLTATTTNISLGVTSGTYVLLSSTNSFVFANNGNATNLTFYGVSTIASTSGVVVNVAAGVATNVIDLAVSSSTNILNAALTILHATNGSTATERTHVRWLWTDGTTRALTIPSGWKTNVNSAVPASITNGAITKMYVTSIGDTTNSANQTNVFVSFEFYK